MACCYCLCGALPELASAGRRETWFGERIQPGLRGYGDDFVCCFENKDEAEQFYERLKHRMKYFGLELEESKSRLAEFGGHAEEKCRARGRKAGRE